jgi:hypothetical protein
MKATGRAVRVTLWLLALAPLLFLISPLRQWTESRMAWHMLLQFPMLLASGWCLASLCSQRSEWLNSYDRIDAQGLLGATLTSCVLAFWMIPAALDMALLSESARAAKYLSLFLAGAAISRSHHRMTDELALFFVGTLVWMMATVGLVYQTLPQRLCVSYLIDEQRWTGAGLVAAASLLGTASAIVLFRRFAARQLAEAGLTAKVMLKT